MTSDCDYPICADRITELEELLREACTVIENLGAIVDSHDYFEYESELQKFRKAL